VHSTVLVLTAEGRSQIKDVSARKGRAWNGQMAGEWKIDMLIMNLA